MIDYDHRTICQYQTPKTNGYVLVLNHIKSMQLGEYYNLLQNIDALRLVSQRLDAPRR